MCQNQSRHCSSTHLNHPFNSIQPMDRSRLLESPTNSIQHSSPSSCTPAAQLPFLPAQVQPTAADNYHSSRPSMSATEFVVTHSRSVAQTMVCSPTYLYSTNLRPFARTLSPGHLNRRKSTCMELSCGLFWTLQSKVLRHSRHERWIDFSETCKLLEAQLILAISAKARNSCT